MIPAIFVPMACLAAPLAAVARVPEDGSEIGFGFEPVVRKSGSAVSYIRGGRAGTCRRGPSGSGLRMNLKTRL